MTQKNDIPYYERLASTRNHQLISVGNPITPSQGTLELYCCTCNNNFSSTGKRYKNARKTGCKACKAIITAGNQQRIREKKLLTSASVSEQVVVTNSKPVARTPKQMTKLSAMFKKQANLQKLNIFSSNELKVHFRKENNPYTNFILTKLEPSYSDSLKSSGQKIESHHIFPRHVGGTNAKWNLINLTRADHVEAHRLRYLTYGEFGDYNFLKTTPGGLKGLPENPEFEKQILQNKQKGVNTQKENKTSIFAEGAAKRGGQASAVAYASLTEEEKLIAAKKHQSSMNVETRNAFQKGLILWHRETNITVTPTVENTPNFSFLLKALIAALPEGNPSRIQLESPKKIMNVTSGLAKMISGKRPSAYGWCFKGFQS